MHNFWKFRGCMADSSHIDWITRPGAKIQSLHKMWHVDCGQESRMQDVLVVEGLNIILHEESIDTIMEFFKDVREQGKAFLPKLDNFLGCYASVSKLNSLAQQN